LEEEMATHSSIFAWRNLWTEEPVGLQSTGLRRLGHDWATNTHTHTHTHAYKPEGICDGNWEARWETRKERINSEVWFEWNKFRALCIFFLNAFWEFPDYPVVRTLCFHCRGPRFHSWLGK